MNYKNILFICTGNICRSPMAKAIFEDMVLKSPELSSARVAVRSAGILNLDHHKASEEAVQVMQECGLDITAHQSQHIDLDLIDWSDLILVMENKHKEYVLNQVLYAQKKVYLLSQFAGEEGEVPDPIGQKIDAYRECAELLTRLIQVVTEKMIKEIMSKQKHVFHCLPGEGSLDESWFEKLNAFEKQETKRQVTFKRERWPRLGDGLWSKRPYYHYPHILPENNLEKTLFPRIADEVFLYLEKEEISLHSEALNLRSSQVCCFNVLFPLKKDKELAGLMLKPILPKVKTVNDIDFEYTGPPGITNWLGEPITGKRGQNRTSIDAAVWWMDDDHNRRITLIEWKYTERGFGSCGGYESDSNKMKNQCRTLNAADSHSASRCYLTTGGSQTKRRYWEHLKEAGIDTKKFAAIQGCPFRGPFYQILRQFLLAAYVCKELDNIDMVDVAAVGFAGNRSLFRCPSYLKPLTKGGKGTILDAWNSVLSGVTPIRNVTVEEIMKEADVVLSKKDPWRVYLTKRYGI